MDSMGKKTAFACGVVVGVGSMWSVVLLSKIRWKKALNLSVEMFRKCDRLLHRLISREEELPDVELWLVVNKLKNVCYGKPVEQAVVVINNQTLQRLNKCKWVSCCLKLVSDIIEIEPPFIQVKPSVQASPSLAVCDGSSSILYLLGGKYFITDDYTGGGKVDAHHINVTNVVSGRRKEEELDSGPLSPMLQINRVVRAAAVTKERMIYVFGRLEVAYDDDNDDGYDTSTFGEIYDIGANRWMPFDELPYKEAARSTVLGCVMWHSMIVLFLQRSVKLQQPQIGDASGKLKYKEETTACYYDLKEKMWICTVVIDEDDDVEISMFCFLVLVGGDDNVFIVQSSGLYRYDLVERRITGKIQGLQHMEERRIRDVVYLGSSSSDGKKFVKFCIFWEECLYPDKFMRFAIIKVGDDDNVYGDKLTVTISSSVASIRVRRDDFFIKGANLTTIREEASKDKNHHIILDELARRREEEEGRKGLDRPLLSF